MQNEKTFVMIKPDAVQRGLVGDIISRFEKKGIKIVAMKMVSVDRELAEKHYGIHKGKSFFEPTIKYITSSPVIALILEGTIRGDFGQFIGRNIIHGSDGVDTAKFEINLWFNQKEISNYSRIDEIWLKE